MSPRTISIAVAAALGAVTVAGCSYYDRGMPPPHQSSRVPAAHVTGPAVSCIPINQFSETRVRDGRTIDFLTTSRQGWRNVLPEDCPGLNREQAFSYGTSLSQLCSTDIIHPLVTTAGRIEPAGACGLGQFTPIELAR